MFTGTLPGHLAAKEYFSVADDQFRLFNVYAEATFNSGDTDLVRQDRLTFFVL